MTNHLKIHSNLLADALHYYQTKHNFLHTNVYDFLSQRLSVNMSKYNILMLIPEQFQSTPFI